MPRFVRIAFVCCLLLRTALVARVAVALEPEHLEFFEKQVRPLLVERCSECHGAKKSEAGLRLDTKRNFLKGADTGPIVVAGNVDGSRLMQVLKYSANETQMPPQGKLSDEQIAAVKKWIELGTPWPDEDVARGTGSSAKDHWAFQPVSRPTIPETRNSERGARSEEEIAAAISSSRSEFRAPFPHRLVHRGGASIEAFEPVGAC